MSIRASSRPEAPVTTGDPVQDARIRRIVESVFGPGDERGLETPLTTPLTEQEEAEMRLARHLRTAGLI